MISKRQKIALSVQSVFRILADQPEGLTSVELWDKLQHSPNGNGHNHHSKDVPASFEQMSFYCVGAIKAGWLNVNRNLWKLSPDGLTAYEQFSDPTELMRQAARQSTQGWLAVNFPDAYAAAGKTKDQFTSELRTIRRVGFQRIFKEALGTTTPWQKELPIQSPRTFVTSNSDLKPTESLTEYLLRKRVEFSEGGHAIFLSSKQFGLSPFSELQADYPSDAGLKIVKKPGSVDEGEYILKSAKGDSKIHLGMVHSHRHLTLVANFLFSQEVGTRLYDLLNIQCGDKVWTAYVVQDVGRTLPSLEQCQLGIEKLRELDAAGVIRVFLPEGFTDEEFICPGCSNNAFVDHEGRFRYIDFQNFLLGNYERYLADLAREAGERTHFGDTTVLRGGRYLYQSVPGVNLPAKRNIANRMNTISALLDQAGVSLVDRVVLDVGCNIGMMMGQYLKLGAKWCHGWDREYVAPFTEKMLLALGCTRFSLTAGDIHTSQPMLTDVPNHVRRTVDGCAISYLAIRGHVGWLEALKEVPWSFMIYEGHEGETAKDLAEDLSRLKDLIDVELGPASSYVDGDSEERTVVIIFRK